MSDLEFVLSRVPGYGRYTDEATRHDTDMRVRAFVGQRLQSVRDRFEDRLGEAEKRLFEAVLMRCQFSDQAFVASLDAAEIDEAQNVALVAHDRELLDLAERIGSADFEQVAPLLNSLDEAFDRRRVPQAA